MTRAPKARKALKAPTSTRPAQGKASKTYLTAAAAAAAGAGIPLALYLYERQRHGTTRAHRDLLAENSNNLRNAALGVKQRLHAAKTYHDSKYWPNSHLTDLLSANAKANSVNRTRAGTIETLVGLLDFGRNAKGSLVKGLRDLFGLAPDYFQAFRKNVWPRIAYYARSQTLVSVAAATSYQLALVNSMLLSSLQYDGKSMPPLSAEQWRLLLPIIQPHVDLLNKLFAVEEAQGKGDDDARLRKVVKQALSVLSREQLLHLKGFLQVKIAELTASSKSAPRSNISRQGSNASVTGPVRHG